MKKVGLIFVILFSISTTAIGDEKHDLVMEMLKITNAKQNHELMVASYLKQMSQSPEFDIPGFEAYFNEALAWDSLIGPLIGIYQETYTVEELKALNKFFSSSVGKSFIAKSPEVNERSSAIIMTNMKGALRHLKEQK